jgi:hypothetical protein
MFWCSLPVDFSIELMHLGLVSEGEVVLVLKSSSASGSNVHRAQILLRARSTLVSNLVFFIIQSRKTSIMTKGVTCFVDPLYIHRQTCYLFGRERRVADIPTDHPSCSKQHAVIQYRLTEKEEPDGMIASKVRPYIMDLGSTNGTFLNGKRIDPQRYYELLETDTIKFGNSSREYVLLHEHSTG